MKLSGKKASLSFLNSNSRGACLVAEPSWVLNDPSLTPGVEGLGHTPRSSDPALGHSSAVGLVMERG
ncbi:hypothetical protein H5410_026285 [Solanum commersonii]|uniref:Uncharacterized protein n=1 Tax=Solanum commersonii TaxID=4109 RepID=A0A9J5YW45_SOLCO|nr:hypothetical protein H5410_026285 [Solanum commersonii]